MFEGEEKSHLEEDKGEEDKFHLPEHGRRSPGTWAQHFVAQHIFRSKHYGHWPYEPSFCSSPESRVPSFSCSATGAPSSARKGGQNKGAPLAPDSSDPHMCFLCSSTLEVAEEPTAEPGCPPGEKEHNTGQSAAHTVARRGRLRWTGSRWWSSAPYDRRVRSGPVA